MTVLFMERAHVPLVAAIERECFAAPWSEAALAGLIENSGFAMIAVEDGTVVAYGGMLTVLDEGQITNVATSAPYRRRGIGGALLLEMIKEARRRGLVSLSLEVRASNAAAISLYERHGFSVAGRRRGFYTHPREDALVMIKEMKD